MRAEVEEKVARVQRFLREQNLGGVVLSRVNNVAWLTGGVADNHIVITSEAGGTSLVVLRDGRRYLVASNSEAPRTMAEDLRGLGYEAREYRWYEDKAEPDRRRAILRELAADPGAEGMPFGTDLPLYDLRPADAAFAPLRYPLTDAEVAKYRWVGRQTAEATELVTRRVRPGMSERELEAMASAELLRRGLRPTVLLMGADDRVFRFNHHTPTDRRVARYAIVNVVARRYGLEASVARFVHFGPAPDSLARRVRASAEIAARYEDASRPGATAGDILAQADGWFRAQGFAGAWRNHHQGGAIGYNPREWIGFPGSRERVHDRQAFAWNPIVLGALSFNTFLVRGGAAESLTTTPDWPAIRVTVNGRTHVMPGLLVQPAASERAAR